MTWQPTLCLGSLSRCAFLQWAERCFIHPTEYIFCGVEAWIQEESEGYDSSYNAIYEMRKIFDASGF